MEPSLTEVVYYIFLGVLTSIGQFFIVILCLYYLFKVGVKADSILLTAGSVIMLLIAIISQVGVLYARIWGTDSYLLFTYFIQGFAFLASLLFAIGFFILIRRVIKTKTQNQR